jgi:hypothetical protein
MIDIQQILTDRDLTVYGAAQIIGAETDETTKAICMRLGRWIKGKPPNLATAILDLNALGFRVVLVAKIGGN